MSEPIVSTTPLPEFSLWEKTKDKRTLISFDIEATARCNNNCRHCYINLPSRDKAACEEELALGEIKRIAAEAVSLGALWCLITGGEPLLRKDFFEIYLTLKKMGLLVSVFTNATLIRDAHVRLFERYPPRDIEVTVYGATKETYEKVTRSPGSFEAFRHGLDLLLEAGIPVRLKAMALRSNRDELPAIFRFCCERTKDNFRFDPFLHQRFDGNPERNKEIRSERLSPLEVVDLERSDPERFQALEKGCDKLIAKDAPDVVCNHLFRCGAGNGSFSLSYNGFFRLCSSLWHPDCAYDLRRGTLTEAYHDFVRRVRGMRSNRKEFLETCRVCPLVSLCMWCPAHAHLETGEMDLPVEFFCNMAHARAGLLTGASNSAQASREKSEDSRYQTPAEQGDRML